MKADIRLGVAQKLHPLLRSPNRRQQIQLLAAHRFDHFRPAQRAANLEADAEPLFQQAEVIRGDAFIVAVFVDELERVKLRIHPDADYRMLAQEGLLRFRQFEPRRRITGSG